MESGTDDMLQRQNGFMTLSTTTVGPESLFGNLDGETGFAYTNNLAYACTELPFLNRCYAFNKLEFQDHMETGSYKPTITLFTPADKHIESTSNDIMFSYDVQTIASIDYCALYINDIVTEINSTMGTGTNQFAQISQMEVTPGKYIVTQQLEERLPLKQDHFQ